MAIIKQYHKDTDTTYVYESESYWDAEKKQSRSRRKVIGKIDPETGEMVPTGKRGRKKKQTAGSGAGNDGDEIARITALYEQASRTIEKQEREIKSLKDATASQKEDIAALKKENRALKNALKKAGAIIGGALS